MSKSGTFTNFYPSEKAQWLEDQRKKKLLQNSKYCNKHTREERLKKSPIDCNPVLSQGAMELCSQQYQASQSSRNEHPFLSTVKNIATGVFNYFTAADKSYEQINSPNSQTSRERIPLRPMHQARQISYNPPSESISSTQFQLVINFNEEDDPLSSDFGHLQLSAIQPLPESSSHHIKKDVSTGLSGQDLTLDELLNRQRRDEERRPLGSVIDMGERMFNKSIQSVWTRLNNHMCRQVPMPRQIEKYRDLKIVTYICNRVMKKKLTADNRIDAFNLQMMRRDPKLIKPIFKKGKKVLTEGYRLGEKRKLEETGFKIQTKVKDKLMKIGESINDPDQSINLKKGKTRVFNEIAKSLVLEGIGLENTLKIEKFVAESKKQALKLKDDTIMQECLKQISFQVIKKLEATSGVSKEPIINKIIRQLTNLEEKQQKQLEDIKKDVRTVEVSQKSNLAMEQKNRDKKYQTIQTAIDELVQKFTNFEDVYSQSQIMSQQSQSSLIAEKLLEEQNKKILELTRQIEKLEKVCSQKMSQVSMAGPSQESVQEQVSLSQAILTKPDVKDPKKDQKKLEPQADSSSNKNAVSFGSATSFPPLKKEESVSSFESVNLSEAENSQKTDQKKEETKPPAINIFQPPASDKPKVDQPSISKPPETKFEFKPITTTTKEEPKPSTDSKIEFKPIQFPVTSTEPPKVPTENKEPTTNSAKIQFLPTTTTTNNQPQISTGAPNPFLVNPQITPTNQPQSTNNQPSPTTNPFLNTNTGSSNPFLTGNSGTNANPFSQGTQNQPTTFNPFKPASFQPSNSGVNSQQNSFSSGMNSMQFQVKPPAQQNTGGQFTFNNPFNAQSNVGGQNSFSGAINQSSGINPFQSPFGQINQNQVNTNNDMEDVTAQPPTSSSYNPFNPQPQVQNQFQAQPSSTMMAAPTQNFTFQPSSQNAFSTPNPFMNTQQQNQPFQQSSYNPPNPSSTSGGPPAFTLGKNKKAEQDDDSLFQSRPIFRAKRTLQR